MWELLEILLSKALKSTSKTFISDFFNSSVGSLLKKLITLKKKSNELRNITPTSLISNFVRSLKPKQAKEFQNTVNKAVRSVHIKKLLFKSFQKRKEQFTQQNGLKEQIFDSLGKNELKDDHIDIFIKSSTLSSSWLVFGIYYGTRKTGAGHLIGNLELTIHPIKSKRPAKNYLYFNVPYNTWKQMTEASGRNGTGAGSVFWNNYLHGYIGGHSKSSNQVRANKVYNIIKGKSGYRNYKFTRPNNVKTLRGYR